MLPLPVPLQGGRSTTKATTKRLAAAISNFVCRRLVERSPSRISFAQDLIGNPPPSPEFPL